MAVRRDLQLQRFPQSKYIDAVRFLPPLSPLSKSIVLSTFDSDSNSSSLEIHTLNPLSSLQLHQSWPSPSRLSSFRVSRNPQKALIAAASSSSSSSCGSLHYLSFDPVEASFHDVLSISDKNFHSVGISGIDLEGGSGECVTVGEDGRVNLVSVDESKLNYRRVFDSSGLVSYTAARWASPAEFATGGLGFSLQWWDQRKPGGPVYQSKGKMIQGITPGILHSIDIHPSRKHLCVVGGSSGTVFAWDLRWPQQPIMLSGVGLSDTSQPLSEGEVWEVQYDHYTRSANLGSSSANIPPVMMCSEDGILAVLEHREEAFEILAEPCAINSFDIDPQNPSDVICSLEWEAIAILMRP